jgi:hypothetical protein
MFSLTIVFGPGPMVWTLMFKTEDTARKSLVDWSVNKTPLLDDFGQECSINLDSIHGYMIEDLEQSRLAHIERALHQARTQAKGAELAEADPVLKQARHRAQGGIPMIQPMPAGFGPNGGFRS